MSEKPQSSEKQSDIGSRLSRELSWIAASGYPVQLRPGVYEPSFSHNDPFDPQSDAEPITSTRSARYVVHEDGSYEITFDEA
jgi:hypothetical protein